MFEIVSSLERWVALPEEVEVSLLEMLEFGAIYDIFVGVGRVAVGRVLCFENE